MNRFSPRLLSRTLAGIALSVAAFSLGFADSPPEGPAAAVAAQESEPALLSVAPSRLDFDPDDYFIIAQKLGLSDQQRADLEKIRRAMLDEMRQLLSTAHRERQKANRLASQLALGANPEEAASWREELASVDARLRDIQRQVIEARAEAGRQSAEVLTPEQAASPALSERLAEKKAQAVRDAFRFLGEALEGWRLEHGSYPASTLGSDPRSLSRGNALLAKMPTFSEEASLLAPVRYLEAGYPEDPFNPNPAGADSVNTFAYFRAEPSRYLLISPGPDGKFNFDPVQLFEEAAKKGETPSWDAYLYDPANGTFSQGDLVWTWPPQRPASQP